MSAYRTRFIVWLCLAALTFVSIPLLYIGGTREVLGFEERKNLIFSVNTAESYLNFVLYHLGISGNMKKSIVGKDGWLYLGDDYANNIHYSRLSVIDQGRIDASLEWFKQREISITKLGPEVVHALPPNKLSVYPEYAPDWLILPERNITDAVVNGAKNSGFEILDLRADLVARKTLEKPLYFKTDSHWNQYGGLIAYERVLSSLQKSKRISIIPVSGIQPRKVPVQAGGNSNLLKINGLLPEDYDTDFDLNFAGSAEDICIRDLDKFSLEPINDCNSQPNSMIRVTRPLLVINEHALNDLSVVWYRDSFGTALSSLMHATFKTIWEIPHHYYYFSNVDCFVANKKPDIVLFMSVERNLIVRVMSELPGPTPAAISRTCPAPVQES